MNDIIDNTEELSNFCDKLLDSNPEFIAIDTEFISNRNHRRFPKLCLIQICYHNTVVVIDVLSDNLNLAALKKVLFNSKIIKVFHDVKHDVLTLLPIFHYIPYPIMDTQMMAMMCDYYQSHISYFDLVHSYLGITIDKDYTRTDWRQRPLSAEQIDYAIGDVTHLYTLYQHLYTKLEKLGRIKWLHKECEEMVSNLDIPYSTKNDVESIIRRTLTSYRNDGKLLSHIPDITIYKIAHSNKCTTSIFEKVVKPEYIDMIESEINELQNLEYEIDLNKKAIIHIIQLVIQQFAVENRISYSMLSSTAEIRRIVYDKMTNIRMLSGWRYEIIGRKIINIIQGKYKLQLEIKDGQVLINIT